MRISFASIMPPDVKEADLEKIRLLEWQLECPRMIVKSRAKISPATYYGAGRVFFTNDGSLRFECYSQREKNTTKWSFSQSIPSGEIIPDSHFYYLKIVDVHGDKWISSRFLPRIHRTADGRAIVRGNVGHLSSTFNWPQDIQWPGSSMMFWVFDDIRIPTNRRTERKQSISKTKLKLTSGSWNAWEFTVNKIKYMLIKEGEETLSFRISSKDKSFPDAFDRRIVEAFQLVLGHPINWMVMINRQGNKSEIRIRSKSLPKGEMLPPLPSGNIRPPNSNKLSPKYHRKLFHCFMRYISNTEDYRHLIWGQLNAIAEASGSSFIDAKVLTLTVAIESLLRSEFSSLGELDQATQESIEAIREYIQAWGGDDSIKERVLGIIRGFKNSSATDKMRKLVDKGAITKDQYSNWKKLRNPTAHSYLSTGIPTPDMIQLMQSCEVLFYHLVFHAIGYEGPYIDYSTPGWPLKEYPGGSLWK